MKRLFTLYDVNYEIYCDDNGNLFANHINEYQNYFDILRDFEKVNPNYEGKKYLTSKTKLSIIEGIKRKQVYLTEETNAIVNSFLEKLENKPKDEVIVKKHDDLSSEIKALTEVVKESLKRNPFEEAMLQGIIEKGKELATDELKENLLDYLKNYVNETYGSLPKKIQIINHDVKKDVQGIFHKDFELILKFVGQNIPTMLVGPAGSGKNHTVEQIAESLDLQFYFTNAITQEYKLTGFIDANGTYHETEFYKAFSKGGLFFFDEIDASVPESLVIINAALANGYFDFPNGKVYAHKDFRVVAAANTFGLGADMMYVGRNQLDAATLDRFALVEFEYDSEVEKSICKNNELYEFIHEMRKQINSKNIRYVVSMRATINASKLFNAGVDINTIIKTVITKSMSKDDINNIVRGMNVNSSNVWFKTLKGEL